METLLRDLRIAWRQLRRAPGFTLVAVLSLAVGIGANTTIYSLLDAVFLRPLPVDEPERMVALFGKHESGDVGFFKGFLPISYPNFEDYRERNEVFADLVTWHGIWVGLAGDEKPQQILGEFVSASYFEMLGLDPHLGRFFTAEEDEPQGAHPVVVLSHGLWQRLGADRSLLGRPLTINGRSLTVVGVAPPGYEGTHTTSRIEAWMPNSMFTLIARPPLNELFEHRAGRFFFVIGRLRDGITLEQAEANVKAIARQLETEHPDLNRGRDVVLTPLAEAAIHPGQRGAYTNAAAFLSVVVGAVLLIACGNVAGLLLARARARSRETAVRLSLGARRSQLVRQYLTEGFLLGLLGAVASIPVAALSLDLLWRFRGPHFGERSLEPGLDVGVLAFALGLGLLTAIIFALVPALQATRPQVLDEIKEQAGAQPRQGRRFALQDLFVVGQVALSLVALTGAGLFLRALDQARAIDPGFDLRSMAFLSFSPGTQGYDEPRARDFYRRTLEAVEAIPGVEGAALGEVPPLAATFLRRAYPEGRGSLSEDGIPVPTSVVGDRYFETLGMAIVSGRGITGADRSDGLPVLVVNQAMADAVWPGEDPVGKRLRFGDQPEVERTVVGVARNAKYASLGEAAEPFAFLPLEQRFAAGMTVYARVVGDPGLVLENVRKVVQELDPNLPLTGIETGESILDRALWGPRTGAALLSSYGLLTLLLAAIGLYGVIAYVAMRRRREIGIRLALGSSRGLVLGRVVRHGLFLVMAGVVLGLGLALLSTRLVANLIFGISAADPLALGASVLVLVAIATLASYLPAWRATRVDPAHVLRAE